jgi:monoamine oxidase
MSSRRQFLRDATLATGGLLLTSSTWGRLITPVKPRVIIIGAGFAGLAAAYYLHQRNVECVILEGRNRIGGRVFSHQIDAAENLVVELGAEWVGLSHIRVQELCNEFGLMLHNNQFDTHLIYQGKHYPSGKWSYSESWEQKFAALIERYKSMERPQQEELDRIDWWRCLVNEGCEGRDLDIRELLDSTDFGESIRHVSAFAALAEYAESSEKNEMDCKIRGGNSKLAEKLADAIGRGKINLEHRVSAVEQNERGIKVICDNGREFTGDKLICTAPTFAVQKIRWLPELPAAQQAALRELQYARINKNPLLFKEKFWKEDRFDLITDQSPHYFYYATKEQGKKKGALLSYTIGDKAAVVANQTDAWRAAMVAQTLDPFFKPVRPLLEKQVNYYWGNDPFSKGAYAVYGRGQWFSVREELQKPHLRTHFAGEHLADWQGFMEGAIVTGEEAAKAVLQ